jgi:hypothetical protein
MPATSVPSVHDLRAEFESILANVLHEEGRHMTADTMERRLLRQLLALGCHLLALFLATRAAATAGRAHRDPAGVHRLYHSERPRHYLSIFGAIALLRPYFYGRGVGGIAPVDAQLSLPATACSDLVRESVEALAVDLPYHKATGVLGRLFGLALSSRLVTEQLAEDAPTVEDYYAEQDPPPVAEEASILVVQADGKGVPILRPTTTPAPVRLGKGQKYGGKKEAILTAVYTIAPAVRTPESVVASLFDTPPEGELPAATDQAARPGPQHKRLWATLAGKEAALTEAAAHVAARDGAHLTDRVALTDGCQALQERVQQQFPTFTLVLDLIHVVEYLWKAANALLGETNPQRIAWVQARTLLLLQSQAELIVAEFLGLAEQLEQTASQAKVLREVAAYLARNQPWLDYARYLAAGWPIATGVIEGACRHLVKDRCERSGMRWTIDGAEALLHVRCAFENGDWDAFHAFRRRQRHVTLYHQPYPDPPTPLELAVLDQPPDSPVSLAA